MVNESQIRATFSVVKGSFAETIAKWPLSWLKSASDFATNPSLAKDFTSYNSYVSYFEPIILQELAAELASSLEKREREPSISLSQLKAFKRVSGRSEEAGELINVIGRRICKEKGTTARAWGYTVDIEAADGIDLEFRDGDILAIWDAHAHDNTSRVPSSALVGIVSRWRGKKTVKVRLAIVPRKDSTNSSSVKRSSAKDPVSASKRSSRRRKTKQGKADVAPNEAAAADAAPNKAAAADDQEAHDWVVFRLGSLVTMQREHEALHLMKNSPLLNELLSPKSAARAQTFQPPGNVLARAREYADMVVKKMKLNPSQHTAINSAMAVSRGFSIIQGPPGTGKTRTVVALLNVLHMTQYQNYYEGLLESLDLGRTDKQSAVPKSGGTGDKAKARGTSESLLENMKGFLTETLSAVRLAEKDTLERPARPRLLVCAPSNAAVDEIVTRIVESGFIDGQGTRYSPELVRTGLSTRVSTAAQSLTSDGQAESFLEPLHPAASSDINADTSSAVMEQKRFMRAWQAKVNSLLAQLKRVPKTPEKRPHIVSLHEQLGRMDRDLRRFSFAASKSLTREEKLRAISATYVEDAQLVFCTLSGAAAIVRASRTQGDGEEMIAPLFDTVVIDEAAQASEPSSLIPLCSNVSRCILVGDPQQLPATVFSSGKSGVAYGQSLLDRLCKTGRALSFLDTQYRMHPAVSSFPRRYFYRNQLKDAESVLGENCSKEWHHCSLKPKLGPYVFLDIISAPERRSHKDQSIFNPAEAELAVLLYKHMRKSYSSDTLFARTERTLSAGFGIITPYGAQKTKIRAALERSGIPTGEVEVDTVDAFQGREKEVVIFSCVRSSSRRGIGFVKDIRRMNVGLTRARSTLIVLGDGSALSSGSADWRALIEDSRSRGCYVKISTLSEALLPTDVHALKRGESEDVKKDMPVNYSNDEERANIHEEGESVVKFNASTDEVNVGEKPPPEGGCRIDGHQRPTDVKGEPEMESSVPRNENAVAAEGSLGPKNVPPVSGKGLKSQNHDVGQWLGEIFEQGSARQTDSQRNGTESPASIWIVGSLQNMGVPLHPGLVQTLTSHVDRGGKLDFETVVAAALTSGAVTPQIAAQLAVQREREVRSGQDLGERGAESLDARPLVYNQKKRKRQLPLKYDRGATHQTYRKGRVTNGGEHKDSPEPIDTYQSKKDTESSEQRTAMPRKRKRAPSEKNNDSGWERLFSKRKKQVIGLKDDCNPLNPGEETRARPKVGQQSSEQEGVGMDDEEPSGPLFFVDRKPAESPIKANKKPVYPEQSTTGTVRGTRKGPSVMQPREGKGFKEAGQESRRPSNHSSQKGDFRGRRRQGRAQGEHGATKGRKARFEHQNNQTRANPRVSWIPTARQERTFKQGSLDGGHVPMTPGGRFALQFNREPPPPPPMHGGVSGMFLNNYPGGMHPVLPPQMAAASPSIPQLGGLPAQLPSGMHSGVPGPIPGFTPGPVAAAYPPPAPGMISGSVSSTMPGQMHPGNVMGVISVAANHPPPNHFSTVPPQNYEQPRDVAPGNNKASKTRRGGRRRRKNSKRNNR